MGMIEDYYYEFIEYYKPIFGNHKNYIRYLYQLSFNNIIRMIKSYEFPEIYNKVFF